MAEAADLRVGAVSRHRPNGEWLGWHPAIFMGDMEIWTRDRFNGGLHQYESEAVAEAREYLAKALGRMMREEA